MSYTLYHADCLDILPTLEAGSVDAVICDPPYGTTACKWDSVIPFEPMWAGIKRVLKPRGACVLFGSQPFTSALVMSNPKWFRCDWMWRKNLATGQGNIHHMPMRMHESILVFARETPIYNPQLTRRTQQEIKQLSRVSVFRGSSEVYQGGLRKGNQNRFDGEWKYPGSVIEIKALHGMDSERVGHPTQKPLALLEYLVKTYTNEGETVLDFTMGSGTTGHACGNLGRRFIGIEKDAGYYEIAAERIATAYEPLRHMQVAI